MGWVIGGLGGIYHTEPVTSTTPIHTTTKKTILYLSILCMNLIVTHLIYGGFLRRVKKN